MTFVELVVVTALLVVLGGAVLGISLESGRAEKFAERGMKATAAGQGILRTLAGDVRAAVRLFAAGAEGGPYTDVFDVTGLGAQRRCDIYRFVCWYLQPLPGKDPKVDPDAFELVRWVSEPTADLDQVEAVTEPVQREALLLHLYHGSNPTEPDAPYPPVRLLWRRGRAFSAAFQRVSAAGAIEPVPPGFKVPADPTRSQFEILGPRGMAVAANSAGAERGLARWALRTDAGAGFPHGFEIQVVGPASARQVLYHLVLTVRRLASAGELRSFAQFTGVATARDL